LIWDCDVSGCGSLRDALKSGPELAVNRLRSEAIIEIYAVVDSGDFQQARLIPARPWVGISIAALYDQKGTAHRPPPRSQGRD